ncbi:hypothetical protein K3495_g3841 [Podosphaera aphanis]|nr:hypothetical protein K3495_g3841 [Podosphaera aphanis]
MRTPHAKKLLEMNQSSLFPPTTKSKKLNREERIITTIEWPPYSPGLNPIEHVWDSMKDYIQYHYPKLDGGRQRSHDELRGMVKSTWYDATEPHKLEKLIRSMGRRCEAVSKTARNQDRKICDHV